MILYTYLLPIIRSLIAGSIIFFGSITFGEAEYFDRVFLIVLTLFLLTKVIDNDINIVGILVIMLTIILLDEVAFLTMSVDFIKVLIYPVAFILLYKLKSDKMASYIVLPLVCITLSAELYWQAIDHPPPLVHYFVTLMVLNLLVRHFLSLRVFISPAFFNQRPTSIHLDWQLYQITKFNIFVIAAVLVEYLIWHTTDVHSWYVYQAYPYIQQILAVVTLLVIVDHIFKSRYFLTT